jgi:flagellar basal body P-ring protein FlgI
MRRTSPSRASGYGVAIACAILVLTGAGNPKKKPEIVPKVEETIGDVATIFGTDIGVEGVGLVIGLDGTGSEPAPSWQQKKLVDEMQKSGVIHADRLLRSQNISLVIVKATVPAGVSNKDKFDLEIELPQASATSSLANGYLMSTRLAERVRTAEGEKDDKVIALGGGPVMIGSAATPTNPKIGRVLGGGRALNEAPYVIQLKESRRSGKTSQLIENVVKQRFHQSEGGYNKGMAVAKTDSALELKVPKVYHHNQDRYHHVINFLHLVDNPELREQRMQAWGKSLLDPKTSGVAALMLEGLGPVAIPTLKQGLASTDDTVKYFSAESLAYLNDADSAAVLFDMARRKFEFRSFALKAMAAMDQSASLLKLRILMSDPDPELRYGAFNALRTLDPNDPFLGKVIHVLDWAPEPEPEDDMAYQIAGTARKKPKARPDDPFTMYVVDCEGPPMVHFTRNLRCELVIFGKGQKILTPVVLGSGGPMLLNAADGDAKIQISKITSRTLDAPEARVTCGLELSEIVREMANLGASYPEVATVIGSAALQKNLPGALAFDALPAASKAYDMAQMASFAPSKKDEALKKTSTDASKKASLLQRMFNPAGK